ncbi:MAG TPA: S8 family peptidase [Bacteroidales bacterium]|nr:S8 family peptidase [Bacteroidales bacterium]
MIIRLLILSELFFLLSFNNSAIKPVSETKGPAAYFYRVYFTNKGDAVVSDYDPEELLSPDALARREKCGAEVPAITDLPVNHEYIEGVIQEGLTWRLSSKWMNTALFTSETQFDTDKITALPFVRKVALVKSPPVKAVKRGDKFGVSNDVAPTGTFRPIGPINGMPLLLSGYTGKGVTIAVLDAGFLNADLIESLGALRLRLGIIKTHDFVENSSNVYGFHGHGTAVLSILAGSLDNIITGTAQGADYMLFRTEDNASEFPVEEDYWVAAAEYADSAGADIITSSLGYYWFDDPAMNYSFSNTDGNTAFITVAADIAASKGILVVASAGNERNKEWVRILFPSDGDSVLCIGAVNQNLTISDFSSSGFSADGRVKPDVVAPGVSVPVQYDPGIWRPGSGTSFSCPVISGMCAALMQATPGATADDIRKTIRESSDRYDHPDSLYGYGLPDFVKALKILEESHTFKPEVTVTAGPNPFVNEINLWFRDSPERLTVTVTDNTGKTILKTEYSTYIGRSYAIKGMSAAAQGVYLVKVETAAGAKVFKMIKVKR